MDEVLAVAAGSTQVTWFVDKAEIGLVEVEIEPAFGLGLAVVAGDGTGVAAEGGEGETSNPEGALLYGLEESVLGVLLVLWV